MTNITETLGALVDPASRADPYPLYARLREAGTVWVEPLSALLVTGYRDCEALLKDPRLSSERGRERRDLFDELLPADAPSSTRQPGFLSLDPPEHTRLRSLVSQAFTARTVARLEPRIVDLIDDLLDRAAERAAERGSVDVVADLAYPLPIAVICRLLGIPLEDERLFRRWSTQLTKMIDGFQAMTPDGTGVPEWVQARIEVSAYMEELVESRKARPGDDLISALIAAEDVDGALTRDELVSTAVLLLIAGHETTVNLIANGVLALLRHPEHAKALTADPGLAPAAVEETLRYDPPVQLSARVLKQDTEVCGVSLQKGSFVYLLLAAAHRDPEANETPERFDPGRSGIKHLAFGLGPHFCIGAPLARLEARLALPRFFQRVLDPALVQDPPPYREHINLRGPASIHVTSSRITDRGVPWHSITA